MKTRLLLLLHLPFLAVLAALAIYFPAVGGDGDTVMHYFFAEQALREPQLFFNLWAKPVFTILAAPSTLLGFTGIKIFNLLCGTLAVFFTGLAAKSLSLRYYWALPFLALLAPAYPYYLLSGLTEPLGALWVAAILLLLIRQQPVPAYILASFLPYVRSEAKVLLVILILYALLQKHYRYLPLLLVGSVFFAILGSIYHNSPLWIFDSPYRSGPSPYGSGPWNHYLKRLLAMHGWPVLLLATLGFTRGIWLVFKGHTPSERRVWLLVLSLFAVLLLAHSSVWALGIFASAGLERVLILVFPAFWLLALLGLHFVLGRLREAVPRQKLALALILLLSVGNSFIANPHTRAYQKTAFWLQPNQALIDEEIAPYLREQYPQARKFVVDEPYLGIALDFNMKDNRYRIDWNAVNLNTWERFDENTLFLWDVNYVPVQYGLKLEKVRAIPWLREEMQWERAGSHFVLFSFNGSFAELKKQYADAQ